MNDDHLHDELERRSGKANVDRDWARRELLPAVTAAIETRPQKVATSRGPAFAGLAGAAAMLLILVVALPRFASAPPATDQASGRPPGTSAPDPIQPQILTAQEFAVGVLTGRLRSSTVLVDGTIGARPSLDAPGCHVSPPESCLMGRLEGTDPSVDVLSRWLATDERDPAVPASDQIWTWWHLPSGPITGTLLLWVNGDGVIEFLGKVDAANAGEAITVAEANQVDVENVDLGNVVLVKGWLWTSGISGEDINILCVEPQFSPPPGLPNDFCSRTGRDAVVDYRNNVASSQTAPEPRLQVQRGAAAAYQGTVGDEPHVFAVAPRLYGGACEGAPPCWKWEVVGRLTVDAEPSPTPTPSPIATETPSVNLESPVLFECPDVNEGAGPVSIEDHTGLVTGCEAAGSEPPEDFGSRLTSSWNQRELTLTWTVGCAVDTDITRIELLARVSAEPDFPYLLVVDRAPPARPPGCFTVVTGREVRIAVNDSVAPADIDLLFMSNGASGDHVESPPHIVDLDLAATNATFSVDEPVDVTASITYWGGEEAVPVSGMRVGFVVEQLDGPLSLQPGFTTLACFNQGQLVHAEPRTYSLADSYLVDPGVDNDYTNVYDPDPFTLPSGIYYVHVRVGLVLGELCTGDRFDLDASIILRVE